MGEKNWKDPKERNPLDGRNQTLQNEFCEQRQPYRHSTPPIIQTVTGGVQAEGRPDGILCWPEPIDGVKWYTDGTLAWYEIEDEVLIEKGDPEAYGMYCGYGNRRSLDEWNTFSVWPDLSWLLNNLDNRSYLAQNRPVSRAVQGSRPILLETNLAILLSRHRHLTVLFEEIARAPSRQAEAYNMLRAALILDGNAETVWAYLEEIPEENRRDFFIHNMIPALTSATSSIQIILEEAVKEVTGESVTGLLRKGCCALTVLMEMNINLDRIVQVILAHDKSFYRSFDRYSGDLMTMALSLDEAGIVEFAGKIVNTLTSRYRELREMLPPLEKGVSTEDYERRLSRYQDRWSNFMYEEVCAIIYEKYREPATKLITDILKEVQKSFPEIPIEW